MEDFYQPFYAQLEKYVGIKLDHTKKYLVDSRLLSLARATGYEDVSSYVKKLTSSSVGAMHWQAFEAMTTNETQFYRDPSFFEALAEVVLPQLIAVRSKERALRIYCGATSTGQEPYSVAMLLKENFPQLDNWNIYIRAIDISEKSIEKARSGIYSPKEVERGLPDHLLRKYFSRKEDGNFEISSAIRSSVSFSRQNLLDDVLVFPRFDLIFLRNVLIYFHNDTKNRILSNIHKKIAVDHGLLILGATESIIANPQFRMVLTGKISTYYPI